MKKRLTAASAKKCMVVLAAGIGLSLLSCANNPGGVSDARSGVTGKGQKVEEPAKPGDVKIVDGREFIYARNIRFNTAPQEPEYVWVNKADYTPGAFESLKGGKAGKDELAPLRKRIEKLEEELRKQDRAASGPTK